MCLSSGVALLDSLELGFVGHYFVWHIRVLLLKRLSCFLINSEQSEVFK